MVCVLQKKSKNKTNASLKQCYEVWNLKLFPCLILLLAYISRANEKLSEIKKVKLYVKLNLRAFMLKYKDSILSSVLRRLKWNVVNLDRVITHEHLFI